jgi:hypothetical protein
VADNNPSITGAAAKLGQSVIGALPPAFLLLCLINVMFIGVVMWFLNEQINDRTQIVSHLLDRCFDIALQAPPTSSPEHH